MTASPPPPPSDDPIAAAEQATWTPPPSAVFGRIHVTYRFVVLARGVGKQDYDPAVHALEDRRTAIEVELQPVDPARGEVRRDLLAESRSWTQILRPSLQACGVTVRSLDDQFVELALVPDGRTYQDRTTNEKKASTTVKLVRVFPDEASCFAAYQARQGGSGGAGPDLSAVRAAGAGMVASGPPAPAGPSRETAARFLPALWQQAGQDVARMAELLAANQLLSAHFGIDSPEVLAIIGGAGAPAPAGAAGDAQAQAVAP